MKTNEYPEKVYVSTDIDRNIVDVTEHNDDVFFDSCEYIRADLVKDLLDKEEKGYWKKHPIQHIIEYIIASILGIVLGIGVCTIVDWVFNL